MTIEIKELAEVIVVFGPGVVAALLMCGLMVKVVKDLFSRQRS